MREVTTGSRTLRTALMAGVLAAAVGAGLAAAPAGPARAVRSPSATPTEPSTAPDVLPPLAPGAGEPAPGKLSGALGPLVRRAALGGQVSVQVQDVATGAVLFAQDPGRPLVPASTAKLLTAAAALSVLGPDHRSLTRVVDDGAGLTLVGGGDVLLSAGHGNGTAVGGHAGLADLADTAAAALRAKGRRSVRLTVDDRIFSGPPVAPGGGASDLAVGFVMPVAALAVGEGVAPGAALSHGAARRVPDPAMAAATTFAALLTQRGIAVSSVARGAAPTGGTVLASVGSAPLSDVAETMLTQSDNTLGEVLARQVALATGHPGTYADGGRAVLAVAARLGVPVAGAALVGGSGLASGSAVPAATMARLLVLAASGAHPELRPVLTGLPVAGVSGTLADRFTGPARAGALGVVRAKTGTLNGVNALAGTVLDADGRLLAFAVLADRTGATATARDALDDVAVALAACGCR